MLGIRDACYCIRRNAVQILADVDILFLQMSFQAACLFYRTLSGLLVDGVCEYEVYQGVYPY